METEDAVTVLETNAVEKRNVDARTDTRGDIADDADAHSPKKRTPKKR